MFLAQLIGIVGIGLLIATFQGRSRRTILRIQILSCIAWSLYYFLVGAYSGAGMVFLGAIRTYAYERYRKYEWVFEISIIIYALMTLLTWKDWTSILPFMGILSASVAMWQKIRATSAICPLYQRHFGSHITSCRVHTWVWWVI